MNGQTCDFCNEPTASLRYPTRGFGLALGRRGRGLSFPVDLSGGWWCCDECATYVDAKRYDELARRTYDKWVTGQVVPPSRKAARLVRAAHLEMYRAFERNRCGDPTRYVRRKAAS